MGWNREERQSQQAERSLVHLGNITGHAQEDSLHCTLEGPESNFFESPFSCLVIDNVSSEGLVRLECVSQDRPRSI